MSLGTAVGIGSAISPASGLTLDIVTDTMVPAGGTIAVVVAWAPEANGVSTTVASVTAGAVTGDEMYVKGGYVTPWDLNTYLAVHRLVVPSGLALGETITVTFSASSFALAAAVAQTGVNPASPLDAANGTFRVLGTANQFWSSGAVATAHREDWLLGAAFSQNSSDYTSTPGGGYSELYDFNSSGHWHLTVVSKNVSVTGGYAADGAWSAVDFSDLAVIVAFKAGTGNPPPANTVLPQITGFTDHDGGGDNCEVGDVLACSTGTWTGGTPMTFEYQWVVGNSQAAIAGATSSTYTVDPDDVSIGRPVACRVTATNPDDAASQRSAQSLVVLDPDAPDDLIYLNSQWQDTPSSVWLDGGWH